MFSRQKSGDNFVANKYSNTHEQSSALYTYHKPYQSQSTSDSILGSSNNQQISKQQPQANQQIHQNNRKSYNAASAQSSDYVSQQSIGSKQVIEKSQNEIGDQEVNTSDIPIQGASSLIDFNILQRNGGEENRNKSIQVLSAVNELNQNQLGHLNGMNNSNNLLTNQISSQSKQNSQLNSAQKKVKSNIFAKQFEQQQQQYQQQQQQLSSLYGQQSSINNVQSKGQILQNQQNGQHQVPSNINLSLKGNKNSLNNVIGLGQKSSNVGTPQNASSSNQTKQDKNLNQPLYSSSFKSLKRDISPIKNAPYQLNNIEDANKNALISNNNSTNPQIVVSSAQSSNSLKANIYKQNSLGEQISKQPQTLINNLLPAGQTSSFIMNGQQVNTPVMSNNTYNGVQLQYAPTTSTSCSNLSKHTKTPTTYDQYLVKHNDQKLQNKNSIESISSISNNTNQQSKSKQYGIQQSKKSSYTSFNVNNTHSQDFNNAQQLYFQEKSPQHTVNSNSNSQTKPNGHRRQNSYSHKSSNVATENDEQIEDYNIQPHQNLNLSVGVKNEHQRSLINFQNGQIEDETSNQYTNINNINNNISNNSQNADSHGQRMSSSSSTQQKQMEQQSSKKEHLGFNNKISFYNNNNGNSSQKQKVQISQYGIKEGTDIYKQNTNSISQIKGKTQQSSQINNNMTKSLYDKNQFNTNGKFEWRHKTEQNEDDNDLQTAQTYAIISVQSSSHKLSEETNKDQQFNYEQQQQLQLQNTNQNLQTNNNSQNSSKHHSQNKSNGFLNQNQQSFDKQFLKNNFTNYVLNQSLSQNQKQQLNQPNHHEQQLLNPNFNQFSSKSAMPSPGSNNIVQRMQKNIFFTKQNSINDESVNTSENQMKNSLDNIPVNQQPKTNEKPSLFKENYHSHFQNKANEESNKQTTQPSSKNSSFYNKKPLSFVLPYDTQLITNNYYYNQTSPASNTQIQIGFDQKLEMSHPANKNISNLQPTADEKLDHKQNQVQQQQQQQHQLASQADKFPQQYQLQLQQQACQDHDQIKNLYYNLQNQNGFLSQQQYDQEKQLQGSSQSIDLQISKGNKLSDQKISQSLNLNVDYSSNQNIEQATKSQINDEQNKLSMSQNNSALSKSDHNSQKTQNKGSGSTYDSFQNNSQQRKKSYNNLLDIPLSTLEQQDIKEEYNSINGTHNIAEQFKMRNKIHEKAINRVNITLKQSKKRNKSNSRNLEDSQDDSGSDGSQSELNSSKTKGPIGTITQSNPITPSNYTKQNRHGSMDNLDSYSNNTQNNSNFSNSQNTYLQNDLQRGQKSEDTKQEQMDSSQRSYHYKAPSDTSAFIRQLYQDDAYRKKSPSKTSAQYCKNLAKNLYNSNQNNLSQQKKQDKNQNSFNASKPSSTQEQMYSSINENTKTIQASSSINQNSQDQNKQSNKNYIQVTQDKQIDIEDPMVQKEFSQIVRNLLRLKNDTSKLHSLLNKNEVKSMNTSLNANITQKMHNKPGNMTTTNSQQQQQQQQQQNKHDQLFEKLYQEIVNKFDLKETSNNTNNSNNNLNGSASSSTNHYNSYMHNSHHQSTSSSSYQQKQF